MGEYEEKRKDGKIIIKHKNTISLLEEWLLTKIKTNNDNLYTDIINPFKEVRKLRQRPAHKVDDDVFNQAYFKKQREILIQSHKSIKTLRWVISQHPKLHDYQPPALLNGKVWTI